MEHIEYPGLSRFQEEVSIKDFQVHFSYYQISVCMRQLLDKSGIYLFAI